MDAIVTAGGIPKPDDPLFVYTQGRSKAMLDLAGKPMVQWVLDALSHADSIGRVVVIGLSEENGLTCAKPLTFIPNHGGMFLNVRAGASKVVELTPNTDIVLSVSSDIPAITHEMVDWMVGEVVKTDHDLYYNVITQKDMEKRFPDSRRSFTHFKDIRVCGGDITAFRAELALSEGGLWEKLMATRKNVLKQAALIGYGTLFLFLLRQLTLNEALKRANMALEINASVLRCPYPEIGMDVDKAFQRDLLHGELSRQESI